MDQKYRVLSIDGGGIRGLIPIILLQRLSRKPTLQGWLDSVYLLAGTSTGGLISLGLANNLTLDELRNVYENRGPIVFQDSLWDDIKDLGSVIGSKYDITNLEEETHRILGDKKLRQLDKRVLVTAFDLDNESDDPASRIWKPKIIHNFPGTDSDGEMLAYKAALYTAAAPTYFPSVDGYIDGGVFANNPSMCALSLLQDSRVHGQCPPLSDIVLLSMGTGTILNYVSGATHDWGYAQWVKPLISILLDGVAGIADYQCEKFLKERYFRLAPSFSPGVNIDMDEVDQIPNLIEFAEQVDLTPTKVWIEKYWM
jgi:patatin-like phospholipase/acyl hydrolase